MIPPGDVVHTDSYDSHHTTMNDPNDLTQAITIFCWVLNVSDSPFSVDINHSKTVDHLGKAIRGENPVTFAGVDAAHLKLWLLNKYEVATPEDGLAQRIQDRIDSSGGQLSHIASKLETTRTLLSVFPEQPPQNCVHVIVECELLPIVMRLRRHS